MTVRRLVVCLLAVVAISIVSVYYHALAVQAGYELARTEAKCARLRVSISSLEGTVTMLASPSRLRAENERLQLGLVGPSKWQQAPTALASARLDSDRQARLARR